VDTKLVQDAITLLVVINPIGAAVYFLTLTAGMDRAARLRVALRASVVAALILLVFIAVGEIVLDGLGVHLPSFRTAGGLILLLVALRMVLSTETRNPFAGAEAAGHDVAIFPLATPFIAGPGAIMAAVLLTENGRFTLFEQARTGGVVVAIMALTYVALLCAAFLQRVLGVTGIMVISRVNGLVLSALAVQTFLEGLRPYFMSLHGPTP
jgi:multiple antibiotic resistance protein